MRFRSLDALTNVELRSLGNPAGGGEDAVQGITCILETAPCSGSVGRCQGLIKPARTLAGPVVAAHPGGSHSG